MVIILISIHDKTLSRVTFLDNEKPGTLHYYNEVWHRYLVEATSTFDFTVPKTGNPDIEYLNESGYASFHYGGKSYLFSIMKVEETEKKLTCYCENLNLELLNETSGEYKADSAKTFVQYFSTYPIDLHLAQLRIGINEVADLSRKLEWTGTDTKLARLLSLVNKFDAECEFVTHLNRDGTLDKIVMNVYRKHDETHQGVGRNRTDITLYYGKQVKEVRRTVDKTGLYTAIKPIGTDGLNISTLDKTELDADGNVLFRSDPGSPHILCPSMRDEYPSQMVNPTGDRYIKLDWSYETKNVNTLYNQALAKLKKVYVPAITYEIDGFYDLEIGDTIKIHDDGFTPLLLLEARVSEQEISFSQPDRNKTTFSNLRALENKLSASIQSGLEALIQGAIPYTADIITTNGLVFKNSAGSTTLTTRVSRGTSIVTDQLSLKWYKDGVEISTNTSITVNASDVMEKAVYRVEASDAAGELKCFAEVTIADVSDGEDGKTQYLHIKYSDDGGQTFTGNNGEDPGKWMGYYIDFTQTDSDNPNMYSWAKVEGPQGEQGTQGPQGEKGDSGGKGDKGDPMGILELPTEPPTKYEGMLWKHTGTVAGLVKNATYRWTGSAWTLFKFRADNIEADSLSAISADLGNVTAGTINGVDIKGSTITGGVITGESQIQTSEQIQWGNYKGDAVSVGMFNGTIYVRQFAPNGTLRGEGLITPFDITVYTASRSFIGMNTEITNLSNSVNQINSNFLNKTYPVGAIYMSVSATNPGSLFGGTWAAWGTGRVPVGIDTSQTEFNSVQKTGGEKTSSQLNSGHTNYGLVNANAGYNDRTIVKGSTVAPNPGGERNAGVSLLQPYITCYMWRRTA